MIFPKASAVVLAVTLGSAAHAFSPFLQQPLRNVDTPRSSNLRNLHVTKATKFDWDSKAAKLGKDIAIIFATFAATTQIAVATPDLLVETQPLKETYSSVIVSAGAPSFGGGSFDTLDFSMVSL